MTATPDETAKVLRAWEKTAARYDKQIAFFERNWFRGGREWLGARVRGRVLEVAIGTGRNLPHYPADATITGIELSPSMLAIAKHRAARLARKADLHTGDAQALPFPDEAFDTVVCALSLCTIPDPAAACARSPTRPPRSARCTGCSCPAGGCCWSTTSAVPGRRSMPRSGSSNG
jgi:ubiquinone/menaquinone biosynthesis C-methylase UbiE